MIDFFSHIFKIIFFNISEICLLISFLLIVYCIYSNIYFFTKGKKRNTDKITNLELNRYSKIEVDARNKYYDYFREEIKREDEILNHRIVWCVTFQGFLFSALALLLVFPWSSPDDIVVLRRLVLFGIGLTGQLVAVSGLIGVIASRHSAENAIAEWEKRNAAWKIYIDIVPQSYGRGDSFNLGRLYSLLMPNIFIIIWFLFSVIYSIYFSKGTNYFCQCEYLV